MVCIINKECSCGKLYEGYFGDDGLCDDCSDMKDEERKAKAEERKTDWIERKIETGDAIREALSEIYDLKKEVDKIVDGTQHGDCYY